MHTTALRTPLGDGPTTFRRLMAGEHGAQPYGQYGAEVGTRWGYPCREDVQKLLRDCIQEVVEGLSHVPPGVRVIVGTGLRGLHLLEDPTARPWQLEAWENAVHEVLPGADVVVLSNACSAGGFALAAAEDLLVQGAPMVIVCAADTATASMLAMIRRGSTDEAHRVRPFDVNRPGVLLGDAAAAVAVSPNDGRTRILSTAVNCDAFHETAPDPNRIFCVMRDAYARADRSITGTDLIVAHGTGTVLNDPAEAQAIFRLLVPGVSPAVTAVKGALGHSSGAAALINLSVAEQAIHTAAIPPIVGLRDPLEDPSLDYVRSPRLGTIRVAQVNAFGFGGVNAVCLLEAA